MADTPTAPVPGGAKLARKATFAAMLASPRALWRFLTDPASPKAPKVLSVLTLLYVVSPIDAVPDWLVPVLGWCDDMGVTAAALAYVASQAARYANENPDIAVRPAEAPTAAPEEKPSTG